MGIFQGGLQISKIRPKLGNRHVGHKWTGPLIWAAPLIQFVPRAHFWFSSESLYEFRGFLKMMIRIPMNSFGFWRRWSESQWIYNTSFFQDYDHNPYELIGFHMCYVLLVYSMCSSYRLYKCFMLVLYVLYILRCL